MITDKEYEQKKRECWDTFNTLGGCEEVVTKKDAFNYAFSKAYALGKQAKDAKVIVHDIQEESVRIYGPFDDLLIETNNQLIFTDIRIQITKQKLEGYYIIFQGKRINISSNGDLEEWPAGLFDKIDNLLLELIQTKIGKDTI